LGGSNFVGGSVFSDSTIESIENSPNDSAHKQGAGCAGTANEKERKNMKVTQSLNARRSTRAFLSREHIQTIDFKRN
jgi:hypothetical protein